MSENDKGPDTCVKRGLTAKRLKGDEQEKVLYTELKRLDENENVVFSLSRKQSSSSRAPTEAWKEEVTGEQAKARPQLPSTSGKIAEKSIPLQALAAFSNPLAEADKEANKKKVDEGKKESQPKDAGSRKRKLGALEEVLKIENQQKRSHKESWLAKGIIVKVMHKGKYHRKKGMVECIKDPFTA